MNQNNGFSVLDMAKSYAAENEIDATDLFKKPVTRNTEEGSTSKEKTSESTIGTTEESSIVGPGRKKKWTPSSELLEGLPDINTTPVTYAKEDIKEGEIEELKNIADDNALQSSRETMDDMSRKLANIEDAKKRAGIRLCQIPPGEFEARIHSAAGDSNYKRAKEGLDEIFKEIIEHYPEFILEWEDPSKNPHPGSQRIGATIVREGMMNEIPDEANSSPHIQDGTALLENSEEVADLKIIINKENLPDVAWTDEEMAKIRNARKIEVNIVEKVDLEYSNIEDLDDNMVDVVLSRYQREVNDVLGPLPASKYRATFTGLSYPEIMDLSHSYEMNDYDGERKKWEIAFKHTKNPSIGPWEEYEFYIHPVTKERIRRAISGENKIEVENIVVPITVITKFDDFLMKTSPLDLTFILWKVLCATAMEKEIVAIDCHGKFRGKKCDKTYEWLYSPKELLVVDNINPTILEEMKKTAEVSSPKEIEDNYKESMLRTNNTVKLITSKYSVVFGHISAYDYLNHVYAKIRTLENQQTIWYSQVKSYEILMILKAFLIPKPGGGYYRIRGVDNFVDIIQEMNEIDWETLSELTKIMLDPYRFPFSLRNTRCPQCKHKSNVPIEDMVKLLFILAQSLSNVQVELKKT